MNIILLSGGSGKRLWPLSNDVRSKQFIKIFKNEDGQYESMVQRVYRQILAVDENADVTIATSKSQVSVIHNQLGDRVGISVEPCRRDTFPAIVLAAAYLHDVKGISREEIVVVCPVDPYVEDDSEEKLQNLKVESLDDLFEEETVNKLEKNEVKKDEHGTYFRYITTEDVELKYTNPNLYSVLKAVTGSLLDAIPDGIRPAMTVSTMLMTP